MDLVMASPIQFAAVDWKPGDGKDLDGFDPEITQHLIDDPVEATGHSALGDLDGGVIFVRLATGGREVDKLPQFGRQAVTPDVLDVLSGAVVPEENDVAHDHERMVGALEKKSNTFNLIGLAPWGSGLDFREHFPSGLGVESSPGALEGADSEPEQELLRL